MVSVASGRTVALSGTVIGFGLLGDTLIYAVLPLYHEAFGVSLVMVGVLLSLNRWIRLVANSAVAAEAQQKAPDLEPVRSGEAEALLLHRLRRQHGQQ